MEFELPLLLIWLPKLFSSKIFLILQTKGRDTPSIYSHDIDVLVVFLIFLLLLLSYILPNVHFSSFMNKALIPASYY